VDEKERHADEDENDVEDMNGPGKSGLRFA
jgi:hypothetical protein